MKDEAADALVCVDLPDVERVLDGGDDVVLVPFDL
jgi:hypothetical protein